ncbi:MAG: ParA family protein, partial [Chloroflexota bacterium]|nr:ParA family protein [Chloroflexota bacterium]
MGLITAVANQKGGTGKSVVATNLAAARVAAGARVLLCDMDPQGNSADMVGAHVAGARSWVDVFEGAVDVAGACLRDVLPGLDLVAAGDESRLSGVEQGLVTVPRREEWLARALHGQHDGYDDVILDCPPSLGQLTTNALLVADRIIAPVNLTDRHAVKGVNELHRSIAVLREVGFEVPTPMILRNFVNQRLLTVQTFAQLVAELNMPVLRTQIPKTEAIANAVAEQVPIVLQDGKGQHARAAAQAFRALAEELWPTTSAAE